MPEAKLPFHQSHAFLIGINEYQHINHLKTAERDARLIGHQLETHHGFTTHYLLGEEATLEGIRELIHHTIPQTVNETDSKPNRIILYFAGHGIALDSDNEPKGFLAPWDAEKEGEEKLLPMAELHTALKKDKVNCRHGLLILDCCFAGAFKWSSNKRHVTRRRPPKVIYETLFRRFTRDESWQAITSSSSDQTAADLINHLSLGHRDNGIWKDSPFVQQFDWEGLEEAEGQPINISQHSPFALALYIALQGEGDRIMKGGRGDGIITGREIHDYLRHWVELVTMSLQRRQTPLIIDLPRHDKGEFVFLHPKHPAFLSPDPGRNPYKGLLAFEEADEKFFFGREDAIKNIIKRLDSKPLTIMTGPAGSGKTSLAQAGIIPALRQKEWQILPALPLSFKELEAERSMLDKDTHSLLIIDDFEQLLATEETAIEHWEKYLMQLQNDFPGLKILLLVRTGFELYYSSTQPTDIEDKALKQWWDLWEESKYRMAPLSKEELSDIIVLPARQVVLFFESEAMVNELVNSVYLAPGALPLLSYFLSALYEAYKKSLRTDRTFNSDDVKEIGGLIGALQKRATATYEAMKPEEQMMLRFLLMRMVKFENGLPSRRKVPFLKLDQVPESWEKGEGHIWSYFLDKEKVNIYHELDFPNDADDELLSKVIDKLEREEKLLVITKDEKTQQLYIEPVHDALITFWPLAQEWFREVGTDTILLQRQLWEAVLEYQQAGQSEGFLWDDNPKLESLKLVLDQRDNWLNQAEHQFIQKSWELKQETIAALKKQRDDAIKAKEEAETARKKVVEESINSSWRATPYLDPGLNKDVRGIYAVISPLMNLKKLKSLSPVPVFVRGPHGDEFNTKSDDFGYYNPDFLIWAKENVIPATNDNLLKILTAPFYRIALQSIVQTFYKVYKYFEYYPEELEELESGYHGHGGTNVYCLEVFGWVDSADVLTPPRHWIYGPLDSFGGNTYDYNTGSTTKARAAAFWLRRKIDGTIIHCSEILEKLIKTYDPEWLEWTNKFWANQSAFSREVEKIDDNIADDMINTMAVFSPEKITSEIKNLRWIYSRLKRVLDYKKLQSWSPVPIFLKGPHVDNITFQADNFGHYNPQFLIWAQQHLLPAERKNENAEDQIFSFGNALSKARNASIYELYKRLYKGYLQSFVRRHYLTYLLLEENRLMRESLITQYQDYLINPQAYFASTRTALQYALMVISYDSSILNNVGPKFDEITGRKNSLSLSLRKQLDGFEPLGFWLRRYIDGTASHFHKIILHILNLYDQEWKEKYVQGWK